MRPIVTTLLVASLGYFVDIYDLILFGVVRIESLKAIGVPSDRLLDVGVWLINCQMAGMLLGGLFWGIIADKKGRTLVMMTSILLYSLANIANAFVFSETSYGVLRLIAGFGLAGEVGAAVTLVSESVSSHRRTFATTALTAFGLMGAVTAGLIGDYFHWKIAYIVGGIMGLVLLLLRMGVAESTVYQNSNPMQRGQLQLFFHCKKRLFRYIACSLVGVPIWFVVGILMTFSPEIMNSLGTTAPISASHAIVICYIGLCVGDITSGLLSHVLRSRRYIISVFLILIAVFVVIYLNWGANSQLIFNILCFMLGFGGGYWAVYITMVAENFGTNLRATAVITVTNWVRGSIIPLTFSVQILKNTFGFSLPHSALVVGAFALALAAGSLWYLSESFGKDLNFHEH